MDKIKCISFPIWPKKYIEFQVGHWKDSCNIFRFDTDITKKCDHAGASISVEIFGYHFYFTFYDCRHWNDEKKRWYTEEDLKELKKKTKKPKISKEEKDMSYEELYEYYNCSQEGCWNRSVEKLLKEIDRRDKDLNRLEFMLKCKKE